MVYEVEKGHDIPNVPVKVTKYPFASMDVGDSFFVPFGEDVPAVVMNRLRSAAGQRSVDGGKKFVVRRMDGGVRVWRTA